MTCRRFLLLSAVALALSACGGGVQHADFENDTGEAVVRHLVSQLPALNPGVPKKYCLVIGEITADGLMTPANDEFVKRFADLNLKFVNAINLKAIEPGPIIVDNEDRLAVFVLQLLSLKKTGETTWQAETGWSYKEEFARKSLKLESKDGKVTVVADVPAK